MKIKTTILLMPLVLAMTVDAAYATTATQAWVRTNVGDPLKENDDKLFANQVVLRDMLNERDASGNWVPLDTEAQLAIPAINELKAALDAKADAADVDLTELNSAIEALQTGKATVADLEALQNTVDALGDTYATDAELSAQINAVKELIPSVSDYVLATDLAKVATTGLYADLEGKPEIPSIEGLATSEQLTTLQTTLEAAINEKQAAGEYLVAEDLKTLNDAVTALQDGKADVSTVTTIQETISELGNTYATKADMTAADQALQAAIDAVEESIAGIDLTAFAKSADVEGALALKEDAANKVATATADEIEAMSSDEKSTKFPSISVAQTIANAAVTKVNEVAGDLSSLQTQVGTNTADIAEIKAAGYQTADDVNTSLSDYSRTDELGALAFKDSVATGDIDDASVTPAKIAGQVPSDGETMFMSVKDDGSAEWVSVKIY